MEKERIPRGIDPRSHFKMGPGGLADVEFAVQLVQFVHGGDRPPLRVTGTLPALDAAVAEGLIDPSDGRTLADAYRFLTRMRNRLFLMLGKPVDSLPVKPEDLEALGVAMGFEGAPRQEFQDAYLRVTRRARKVAEALIYGS